jgi:hypothetical protein
MSVTPIIGCMANLPRPDYEPPYITVLRQASEYTSVEEAARAIINEAAAIDPAMARALGDYEAAFRSVLGTRDAEMAAASARLNELARSAFSSSSPALWVLGRCGLRTFNLAATDDNFAQLPWCIRSDD